MFRLTISLGNAAMESMGDVSRALAELAERLTEKWDADEYAPAAGTIRDTNGNTVGTWTFTPGE